MNAVARNPSGNDLSNTTSPGEDCSGICSKTAWCTHYTWTNFNGGTCWLKFGNVGKNNATSSTDKSMVCGIVGPVVAARRAGIYFIFIF